MTVYHKSRIEQAEEAIRYEEAVRYVEVLPTRVQQSLLLFLLRQQTEEKVGQLSKDELINCMNEILNLLVHTCASAEIMVQADIAQADCER